MIGWLGSLQSQIIFRDIKPLEDSATVMLLYKQATWIQDSLLAMDFPTHTLEIVETVQSKYLTVDGRLNVFLWDGATWNNISKSKYHGYNFRSKKFAWNNFIYSFGGYGMWREHGDLIRFDPKLGEWETEGIKTKEDIGNHISFLQDSFLVVVNPVSRNQHVNSSIKRRGLYKINLNSKEVIRENSTDETNQFKFATRLETENYYLSSHNPPQIIHKESLRFKTTDITLFHALYPYDNHALYWIRSDSIWIYPSDTSKSPAYYNLADIYSNMQSYELGLVKPRTYVLILFVSLLVLLAGAFVHLKTRRPKPKEITTQIDHPMILKLMVHKGNTINQDELDKILEIDQIKTPETQKFKRASLYNELNRLYSSKTGVDLIGRIPDPEDKRRNLYKIH